MLLTHLLAARQRGVAPQLIALSAVIGHINHFDEWIDCKSLVTAVRPVPLIEGVLDRSGSFNIWTLTATNSCPSLCHTTTYRYGERSQRTGSNRSTDQAARSGDHRECYRLMEQVSIPDTFRVIVDTATLGSNLPSNATMTSLASLMFGLRTASTGKLAPPACLLPAVFRPGPSHGFTALTLDASLDNPIIPTVQGAHSRRELIVSVRDQEGGAHSDTDAKLQNRRPTFEMSSTWHPSCALAAQN